MSSIIRAIASATLAIALALAGCERKDDGAGSGAKSKKILIGIIGKSQSNQVFQAAHAGARDAAKELGAKYGVEVVLDLQTPTDENAQRQSEAVEALTRAGAHGIAISCSEANTVTPAINRAVEAGTLVMCFDSDAPRSKRLYYYGTDDVSCGQSVMKELAKAMNDQGTIAILAGNQSAPNLQARVQGVREEMKNHPNIKELRNGQGVFYHPETPEQAAEQVATAQSTYPEIQGWAMIGGWPLFTRNALRWPPGSVKVVSVDALPAQLPYLESGHVEVLLAQDCYGWGHKSVQMLLDKIVHNKDPEGGNRVIDPLTRVTKENAAEYGKNWDKWLGR